MNDVTRSFLSDCIFTLLLGAFKFRYSVFAVKFFVGAIFFVS